MEQNKQKKAKTKHFRWSKIMEHLFLEILADEALKGNKPSSTFCPTSFARVAQLVSEKFGVICIPEHVKNHLRTIKNSWNIIQTLRSKNDFGWDENLKMITADKKVHDEEVMAHPTHEKYLNKKIEMYEEIALVVGKDIANGCFAKQFGDVDLTLETEDASTRTEFDYEDVSKEAGKDIGKESSSTVSEKRSHKKRKTRDDESLKISEHMSEMAKAMKALSQDQKQDRISSLYKVVMAIEGYDEVALARAFDYMLENENVGRGFMVKNDFFAKGMA